MLAKTVLKPTIQAAITTQQYNASVFGTRDLTELATIFRGQSQVPESITLCFYVTAKKSCPENPC
jgi:hypothetical protein